MAIKKTANAIVTDLISFSAWEKMQGKKAFGQKTASTKRIAADQSRYLLSHATIMASVAVEEPPFDYKILPVTSHLVNSNQDAWTTGVLRKSYRTFVGAFNFLEHVQETKEAKGHILDSVLRLVTVAPGVQVAYIDILVATDLKHESLVSDIRSRKRKWLSMGCVTDFVICSACGARCTETYTYCNHLLGQKGEFLLDEDGIPRIVAELCGHESLPGGGVKFVEASWVGTPAFPGAASRDIVAEEWIGPKTPYTHAFTASGQRKVATSATPIVAATVADLKNFEDQRRDAKLRRLV